MGFRGASLEDLVDSLKHLSIYQSKKILITGHTGFKGSWLSLWLQHLGAEVMGLSLSVPTIPSHFERLKLDMESRFVDIRDLDKLKKTIRDFKPDIIFHLAAQPLVRVSYHDPIETLETNIMGTANLFEAARGIESLRAIICITSDKCYENKETDYAYKEDDPLGGHDPYSASKGCAEIISASYAKSFFPIKDFGSSHRCLISTARAGNVIGGGDWAEYRLLPDIFRNYALKKATIVKNPLAVRPWQHVLEPLNGYLMLGENLLEGRQDFSGPWNFGPNSSSCIRVIDILTKIQALLSNFTFEIRGDDVHEATLLQLDSSKANTQLKWRPLLNIDDTLSFTADWYRSFYDNKIVSSLKQIQQYMEMKS